MEGLRGRTPFEQLGNWVCDIAKANIQPFAKPHAILRWLVTSLLVVLYVLRFASMEGFKGMSCGLGIYTLNLIMGFTSPIVDPKKRGPHAFEPFNRLLPEFEFWYLLTRAVFIGYLLSFVPSLDFPLLLPVLVCYGIVALGLLVHSVMSLGYYVSIKRSASDESKTC